MVHYWNGGYTIGMVAILLKRWLTIGMVAIHYWNGGYTIENVAHYWNGGYTIGMVAILLKYGYNLPI